MPVSVAVVVLVGTVGRVQGATADGNDQSGRWCWR